MSYYCDPTMAQVRAAEKREPKRTALRKLSTTVRLSDDNDLEVIPTIGVYTGKPLVELWQGGNSGTEIMMRPIEAERLARALLKAARQARAKVRR